MAKKGIGMIRMSTANNGTGGDQPVAELFSPQLLTDRTVQQLRDWSAVAEENGCLHPDQISLAHQHRWFHLFVPRQYGGLGLPLPHIVQLEEEIAFADGSVGWVVTLCAGAAMFVGYFEPSLAKQVFVNEAVIIAGSGQIAGTARVVEGGYLVSGAWPYASGAPHAHWLTGNCRIEGTGDEQVMSFIFKRQEVQLQPSWNYLGLNATAGHSFEVADLFVPAERAFRISADAAVLADIIYQYPFLQLAEATLAANISGMCLYFFELAAGILGTKQPSHPRAQQAIEKGRRMIHTAVREVNELRHRFFSDVEGSRADIQSGAGSSEALLRVSKSSRQLARTARNLVNEVYPYCGLEAARTGSAIGRVWRNINTASQHTLLLEVD